MGKIKVICKECNKEEMVCPSRAKKYITCSTTCMGKYNSKRYGNKVEKICECCKKIFLVKFSSIDRRKCCSRECHNKLLPMKFLGIGNPNYKGRNLDCDGYLFVNDNRIKEHRKVAMKILDLQIIPRKYHIHHRDGNKRNNIPNNLSILKVSDHTWLHKQFGSAILKAFMTNKIDLDTICRWSSNLEKAKFLLLQNIIEQSVVLKQGELLENLFDKDNQQPSLSSNTQEGSTTNLRVQTDNAEDSNEDTSALQLK